MAIAGTLGVVVVLPFSNATALAAKTDACADCHGLDGNSFESAYRSLAGQIKEYSYRQIKSFREGTREDPMMSPAAAVLSDQDMQELAEFFASQTLTRNSFTTDPAVVFPGQETPGSIATCCLPSARVQGIERIRQAFAADVHLSDQTTERLSL